MDFGSVSAAFGTSDRFAFRLESCQGFACALADERSFDLRRESKSESEHFGLDVVSQPVAVFDGPNGTTAVHAQTEDLHDHVQISAQPAQFAADDQIAFLDMFEQFAKLAFGVRFGARDGFFDPSVHDETFLLAKPFDLKALIFYCLLITTDANISVFHGW